MNRFPDRLHLSIWGAHSECRTYRVDAPFRWFGVVKVYVPEGFLTDGASIPRCLWPIFSSTGKALYAGVIHDFRYSPLSDCQNRKLADQELYDGCRECGMGMIKATLVYRAVRLFGGKFWKTKQKHECYAPEP